MVESLVVDLTADATPRPQRYVLEDNEGIPGHEVADLAHSEKKEEAEKPVVAPKNSYPAWVCHSSKARKRQRAQQVKRKRVQERHEAAAKLQAPYPLYPNFVIIDSSDEESDVTEEHQAPPPPRRRRAPSPAYNRHPDNHYRFDEQTEYNYQYSAQAAQEMQERLFRQSAERLRRQASVCVEEQSTSQHSITFDGPILDIAEQYPHHYQWKDPYACLGLQPGASVILVRRQYRRLARLYHPDKARTSATAHKFHAVTTAYRKLTHDD